MRPGWTVCAVRWCRSLNTIRADNNKKLDEIRGTVEEKLQDTLQQRINDSFKTVSAQLEQVYKGLGEMQNLAADVGSLKQVLSGVKTRGILGEVQLGAIFGADPGPPASTPATSPPCPAARTAWSTPSRCRGAERHGLAAHRREIPGRYLRAFAGGAGARRCCRCGRHAQGAEQRPARRGQGHPRQSTLRCPYTTSFGILFLPFEGLYAEVVSSGVTELLQRDYQITVAGPSTMAALLNALQMGFRTLAIQKRSGEVWTILGAVKTEFEKFGAGLQQMQRHLNQTGSDLEELIGPPQPRHHPQARIRPAA